MKKDTKERILTAATSLMTEKGYSNVAVKDIANTAGVSEMTVFRHFETKMGILHAVLQAHSYIPFFERFFAQELSGNLTHDLQQIAHTYLAYMEKNKPIFLIATQDRNRLPFQYSNPTVTKTTGHLFSIPNQSRNFEGYGYIWASYSFFNESLWFFCHQCIMGQSFFKGSKRTFYSSISRYFCEWSKHIAFPSLCC